MSGAASAAEEARVSGIVREVLASALREGGRTGLVIGAAPGPERALLERWCRGGPSLTTPAPETVAPVRAALECEAAAWMAVGGVHAIRHDRLLVHPANKAMLLLGRVPLAPCYPLGDLWPCQITGWAGDATLPPVLRGLAPEVAREVQDRLRAGLEGGGGVARALRGLDSEVVEPILAVLAGGRARARPPLIPRLTAWTLGSDPPP
ncbi:MAG: hypothetical protein RQ751_01705 [Longimicrobiales bacterium]|nr:hypothetical protein [Longimicrobiales bacterium]